MWRNNLCTNLYPNDVRFVSGLNKVPVALVFTDISLPFADVSYKVMEITNITTLFAWKPQFDEWLCVYNGVLQLTAVGSCPVYLGAI